MYALHCIVTKYSSLGGECLRDLSAKWVVRK